MKQGTDQWFIKRKLALQALRHAEQKPSDILMLI